MKERYKHLIRRFNISLINSLLSGTHFYGAKRLLLRWSGFNIGNNVRVVGPLFCAAELQVGDNTFIGRDFSGFGNGSIVIGPNCDIAPEVALLTGSHDIGDSSHRAGKGISYKIIIEHGCWIGARTTIVGDTTVGAGSVVACCSVVIHDIEENSLVAGNPATLKRQLKTE